MTKPCNEQCAYESLFSNFSNFVQVLFLHSLKYFLPQKILILTKNDKLILHFYISFVHVDEAEFCSTLNSVADFNNAKLLSVGCQIQLYIFFTGEC